jgi:hypothetical protein
MNGKVQHQEIAGNVEAGFAAAPARRGVVARRCGMALLSVMALAVWSAPTAWAVDVNVYPGNIGSGSMTVDNTSLDGGGWRLDGIIFGSHLGGAPYTHMSGTSITQTTALQGFVDLSNTYTPTSGEWSQYYAKFMVRDNTNIGAEVVFGTDWLNAWFGLDPQPWDRIRLENNMGQPQPERYYATEGGISDRNLDGSFAGVGNGQEIYPSDRRYYFQLIADPVNETFTLQVYGKGSSAYADGVGWPTQNMFDDPLWLEIGSISAPGFDFSDFGLFAQLWAPKDTNGDVQTSTVSWEALNFGDPLTFNQIPVPEPATLGLLALGGMALLRRRRA